MLVALLAADHEATAALETVGVDVLALRSSADEVVHYQSG